MSLVNLKTNLKSLRYGRDRAGGGDSGQPYIQTPIPGKTSIIPNIGIFGGGTGGEDFLLRGGTQTPSRALKDVSRLTKMFFDLKSPNGILFAAKQNVLSRVGVKNQASGFLNEGIYTPLSTLAQAVGTPFGIHVNKQGLNPFQSTAPDDEPGFLGIQSPLRLPIYAQVVKSDQDQKDNRLIQLKDSKIGSTINRDDQGGLFGGQTFGQILGQINPFKNKLKSIVKTIFTDKTQKLGISTYSTEILRYGGGPGSVLGVGQTAIKRYSNTNEGIEKANAALIDTKSPFGKTPLSNALINLTGGGGANIGATPDLFSFPSLTSQFGLPFLKNDQSLAPYLVTNTNEGLDFNRVGNNYNPLDLRNIFGGRYYVLDSSTILNQSSSKDKTSTQDFRTSLLTQQAKGFKKNILASAPDYNKKQIEQRVNLGDPGKRNKNTISYNTGLLDENKKAYGALDKITAMPLYKLKKANHYGERNDLIKFSIGIIDNQDPQQRVYIHFRALLDSMDDQYTAEWNDFRYMGRGEKFYRYNGFTRTVNLSWTVPAQSKEELIPMYQKLNFLASSLTPDYSPNGYMRGNLAVLTVGGYLFEQPGIINSINYSVPQESPWEIGINDGKPNFDSDHTVKELPHIIKVTGFNFTPIHEFVPRLQQNTYEGTYADKDGVHTLKAAISKFGLPTDNTVKERYIALSRDTIPTGPTTNYNPLNDYTWSTAAIKHREDRVAKLVTQYP